MSNVGLDKILPSPLSLLFLMLQSLLKFLLQSVADFVAPALPQAQPYSWMIYTEVKEKSALFGAGLHHLGLGPVRLSDSWAGFLTAEGEDG